MTPTDRAMVQRRARVAYELGRVRHGVTRAVWVLPLLMLSISFGHHLLLTLLAGALMFTLVALFTVLGGALGRAVVPGLSSATAAVLLPMLLRGSGHCCVGGACWSMCMVGCIGGGLMAGIGVGVMSLSEADHRGTFLLGATLVAGIGGVMGCAVFGTTGVVAMLLAVLIGSIPIAMLTPAVSRR